MTAEFVRVESRSSKDAHRRRVSTVVVQQFCKLLVGGSNPSPGTNFQGLTITAASPIVHSQYLAVDKWWTEIPVESLSSVVEDYLSYKD